jgi:hypothetical protein
MITLKDILDNKKIILESANQFYFTRVRIFINQTTEQEPLKLVVDCQPDGMLVFRRLAGGGGVGARTV